MTDGKKKYSDYLKERDAPDSWKKEHPVLREAPDFTRNKYFQDVETMTYGLDETEGQTNYPVDNTQEPVQPPKFDLSIPEGIKNGITKPNIQNVVTDLLGLDQPTGNKYFPNIKPVTMGDRLPFLKDRGISVNLPEKTFTPEGTIQTEGQPNQKDLTFQQKGLNQINNILLGWNQHNTGAGDAIRELLTPVYSGYERMKEGISQLPDNPIKGAGNIGLGASSEAFGLLMSPFSAIRMGAEKVGGKTAGTIAELGALTLTGGIPMIAGYFAAQGLGGLAEKISKGLELTPKETETVQEVTGLLGFLGGVKGAQKFGSMINTKLGQSVTKYAIDLERQNRLDLAPQFKTKPNLTRPVEGVTQEKLPLELLKENPEIINLLKGKENVQEQSPTGIPIQPETGISEGVRKKDTETGLQKPTKTRVETKQVKNDRQTQTNVKDVAGEIISIKS
ncbi:MAG: hypothetical protein IPJ03_16385 [Ignavibacteriales bacterium]|nr:hypothetical protein [Ignavibacteriales bacterium]